MTADATAPWGPDDGQVIARRDLRDLVVAFPKRRKRPLTDTERVRTAVACFDQVSEDAGRDLADASIQKAAPRYGIELSETDGKKLRVASTLRSIEMLDAARDAEHPLHERRDGRLEVVLDPPA